MTYVLVAGVVVARVCVTPVLSRRRSSRRVDGCGSPVLGRRSRPRGSLVGRSPIVVARRHVDRRTSAFRSRPRRTICSQFPPMDRLLKTQRSLPCTLLSPGLAVTHPPSTIFSRAEYQRGTIICLRNPISRSKKRWTTKVYQVRQQLPALPQYSIGYCTYYFHYFYSRGLARNHDMPLNTNIQHQKALDLRGTLGQAPISYTTTIRQKLLHLLLPLSLLQKLSAEPSHTSEPQYLDPKSVGSQRCITLGNNFLHYHKTPVSTVSKILNFCTLEKQVKVTEYNFAMRSFAGNYQNLQQSSHTFCASSHCFRDINISNIFDLEKVGQGLGLEVSHWSSSMENIKMQKKKCYISDFRQGTTYANKIKRQTE